MPKFSADIRPKHATPQWKQWVYWYLTQYLNDQFIFRQHSVASIQRIIDNWTYFLSPESLSDLRVKMEPRLQRLRYMVTSQRHRFRIKEEGSKSEKRSKHSKSTPQVQTEPKCSEINRSLWSPGTWLNVFLSIVKPAKKQQTVNSHRSASESSFDNKKQT